MTGRSWRHFSIFWRFMVAGLIGVPDTGEPAAATLDGVPVAPTRRMPHGPGGTGSTTGETSSDDDSSVASASSGGSAGVDSSDFDDGWVAVPGDDLAVADDSVGALPNMDVASSSAYAEHFCDMPLHEAYLVLFCQAARVGGMLFGDNVANATVVTEADVNDIDEAAKELGVDFIQTLYGHVNTTKLHRLVQHLGEELRNRGNLWEGDTSVNEKLHGSCKCMFKRSNKRGPGVALQMMRCEETQSAVIKELCEADDDEGSGVPSEEDGGHSQAPAPPTQTSDLTFTGRAQRVAVTILCRIPALANLGAVLRLHDTAWVTLHRTVRVMARFEWGAPPVLQHLRAADSFFGKPWYSFVRYENNDGDLCWGRMRLVLRSLDGEACSCVVVQRMRRVPSPRGCALTRYGCVRLAWEFPMTKTPTRPWSWLTPPASFVRRTSRWTGATLENASVCAPCRATSRTRRRSAGPRVISLTCSIRGRPVVEHGSAIPFVCTYPVEHWDSVLGTYLCTCCMFCTCVYLICWSRSGHSLLG